MSLFLNIDCMDAVHGLPSYPDKHFDLGIADPPYGELCNLRGGSASKGGNGWKGNINDAYGWNFAPGADFFDLLFTKCKNVIIWGANYFTPHLPPSQGWAVWAKGMGMTMADAELAYTSFDRATRQFDWHRANEKGIAKKSLACDRPFTSIHPTQKPVALGLWLLREYAQPGHIILDPMAGSGSFLVACERLGFQYTAFEKDADMHAKASDRIKTHTQDMAIKTLFT